MALEERAAPYFEASIAERENFAASEMTGATVEAVLDLTALYLRAAPYFGASIVGCNSSLSRAAP